MLVDLSTVSELRDFLARTEAVLRDMAPDDPARLRLVGHRDRLTADIARHEAGEPPPDPESDRGAPPQSAPVEDTGNVQAPVENHNSTLEPVSNTDAPVPGYFDAMKRAAAGMRGKAARGEPADSDDLEADERGKITTFLKKKLNKTLDDLLTLRPDFFQHPRVERNAIFNDVVSAWREEQRYEKRVQKNLALGLPENLYELPEDEKKRLQQNVHKKASRARARAANPPKPRGRPSIYGKPMTAAEYKREQRKRKKEGEAKLPAEEDTLAERVKTNPHFGMF